ncbi:MAG TPA: bifunctional diaminohydroxyphosphoribosylaminopyrimidine deaminase/5-amino-6-(5-phosphoribosylamino)uracil reductase RibD, partial [Rhodobacteraceae bacterium]|nr:bifunctional diaminohydroxyphosphoribosylaminopyrimidine deaminase/5-amino-6-(5-phosphoribosylamino)uracil reductase RibD [Paracoccaceae bacterium]
MKANNDPRWMQLALSLGARGLGQVAPNPAVGCVIVRDGRVLGRGWTQPTGRPHAETVALKQAGNAHGATAYVTLEPCAHQGKTPPCANALIEAGISRVVCPLADPDSRVSGKGFEMLRAAGTTVDIGLMASEARAANAGFLLTKTHNRPLLTLKLALSLDGRIATHTGESRWITGPQARARVQHMRATHDAVMIGRATAEADNPMLAIDGFGPTPP